MEAVQKHHITGQNALYYSAVLLLLVLLVWKSNIGTEILLPFISLGVVTAIILCLIKIIKLPKPLILFSCVFASLVCCGFYYAFSFIFDLYLNKYSFGLSSGPSLTDIKEIYNLPSLIVSASAYPFSVFIIIIITNTISSGFCDLKIKKYFSEEHFKNAGKAFFKTAGGMITGVVIAAVFGTLLIWTAYTLPSDRIAENVSNSTDVFLDEGARPSLSSWATSILDNYTDALILLETADENESSALENALMNHKGTIEGADPVQTLIRHFEEGEEYDSETPYSRYWHGYTVILKPLMLLFNYKQVRDLILLFQILLTILVCFLLFKNKRENLISPFLLTYLMLMPPVMGKSLQYSACFFVMLLSVTALLLSKKKHFAVIFLFTGAATAYFDLLTFPIMTFGMPAAVFLSLSRSEDPEQKLLLIVRNGAFWGAGYAGMWASKWIIADVVTGSSVIGDALETILLRTSDSVAEEGVEALSAFTVIGRNLLAFAFTPVTLAVIIYLLVLAIKLFKSKSFRSSTADLLPFMILFLLPFLWYAFVANHSMLHFWFTNKALSVSAFSILCAVSELNTSVHVARLRDQAKSK